MRLYVRCLNKGMYQTTDKDLWGWDYAKLHMYLN